jgi:predicted glycoside hydrolase/deacetylase ChbG (UPF0249 family)
MKRLLIRADDLGFSEGVNYGIEKSVKSGIIRTVGVMPNMEAAEHGINLLRDETICYGQHTNICVGKPITDPMLIPSITGKDGMLKSSSEYRNAKTDFVVLDEVILEIEAQYKRFVELVGRKPDYFEGHAVKSENFFKGLEIVAKRHGVNYLEFKLDGSPTLFGNGVIYNHMRSMEPEYDPAKAVMQIPFHEGTNELDAYICHPGYLDAYILEKSSLTIPRPKEVEMLCNPKIKDWIAEQQITLVTYSDLTA